MCICGTTIFKFGTNDIPEHLQHNFENAVIKKEFFLFDCEFNGYGFVIYVEP